MVEWLERSIVGSSEPEFISSYFQSFPILRYLVVGKTDSLENLEFTVSVHSVRNIINLGYAEKAALVARNP